MPNGNTSATGGFLVEVSTPVLNDQALRNFLHDIIAGVTELDNELVRPGWDLNPPVRPKIDVDWVSFSITEQRPDNDPYKKLQDNDTLQLSRHEEFDVLCSFYGPNSQGLSSAFRDTMYISQNSEQLRSVNMGLVGFGNSLHVPEIINDLYFERYDVTMTLRREILREYPVLSFLGVTGQIIADQGVDEITQDFTVEQ